MTRTLSKEFLSDPTQTKRVVKTYERMLLALYQNALKKVLYSFERARHLAATEFNLTWFLDELGLVYDREVLIPAKAPAGAFISKSYLMGLAFGSKTLKQVNITATLTPTPADFKVIDILQTRNFAALKGVNDETAKKIMSELSDGITKGESIDDLRRRITDSVDSISAPRAETIARTETLYAFNTAAKEQYNRYGVSKVEWLTAYDERVCIECGPLQGKQFEIDSAPDCPLHPNCRCTLLPVIED